MGRERTRIEVACESCGNIFPVHQSGLSEESGKYCSRACYYKGRYGRVPDHALASVVTKKICTACGNEFVVGGRGRGPKDQGMCSDACQMAARYRRSEQEPRLMSATEAAYLAGILDGEGSIMLQGRGDAVAMGLGVYNTDSSLFLWIMKTVESGSVCKVRQKTAKHKASFFWRVGGEVASKVLSQIRPYLVIKADRADLAIAFQERLRTPALKADHTWQHDWMLKMKKLNKRGPV